MKVALSTLVNVAADAGFPTDKTSLIRRLRQEGSEPTTDITYRGQRGYVYTVSDLPAPFRQVLETEEPASFDCYTSAPLKQREEANRRLAMVRRVRDSIGNGSTLEACYAVVADEFGVSPSTVKRAWKAVRSAPEDEWLALLVKDYKGRQPDEIAPEILAYFFLDYGRVEKPQAQAVYERLVKMAEFKSWGPVPSLETLKRRWAGLPKATKVLWREGDKALGDLFPYAERDRSGMKPLDMISVDGREWDLMAEWPDGRKARAVITAVIDVASNYLLGWIVADVESTDIYRRVLCEVFTKHGIPSFAQFDNTRAAANKQLTAGAPGRHRFKNQPWDVQGILPTIGCIPRFATPENGQSKPVERAFLDLKERSERDPRLAGAYTGRSPSEKPANYGSSAVPIDLLKIVLAEAAEDYNTRTNRRGGIAHNTSYRAIFEAGLKDTSVRRLSEEQRRYFFSVAELRTVEREGSVFLGKRPHRNRYWAQSLQDHIGKKVIVRYDPDDLRSPVMVETRDGRMIDAAVPILEKRGFDSRADAREHARAKREYVKSAKQQAAALRKMVDLEYGAPLPEPETSRAAETPVVAPEFKRKKPTRQPEIRSVNTELLEKALALHEQQAKYG